MQLKLQNVRIAFPNLWEAKTVNGEGDAAFSASFIISKDHPQIAEINKLVDEVAKEKWGEKATVHLTAMRAGDKTALHNGDLKANYAGFPGNFYISARSKTKPGVFDNRIDPATGKVAKLVQMDGRPYAGCYVNATLDLWAQDNKYGKRVNASVTGVQFLKDGEAFSGSAPASADDFDAMPEANEQTAVVA